MYDMFLCIHIEMKLMVDIQSPYVVLTRSHIQEIPKMNQMSSQDILGLCIVCVLSCGILLTMDTIQHHAFVN